MTPLAALAALAGYRTSIMRGQRDRPRISRPTALAALLHCSSPYGPRLTPGAGTSEATVAGWKVDDIEKEVADLRSRGMVFKEYDKEYDVPDFRNDDSIFSHGSIRSPGFKNGEGNILRIVELDALAS